MNTNNAAAVNVPRVVVHWTDAEVAQLQPWVDDREQKVDDIARRFSEVHPHRNFEAVRQKVYKMRRLADGVAEPIRRGSSAPPMLTSMLPPPASLPPPSAVPQANGEPKRSTMRPSARSAPTLPPTAATEPRMTLELPNGAKVRGTVEQIAALLQRLK